MKPYRMIYHFGTLVSRKVILQQYGLPFYRRFRRCSMEWVNRVAPRTPDIGNTIFSWNYAFTPAYIAWWKAACEELTTKEADQLLWAINEAIFSAVPQKLRSACVKVYLNHFRKKAPIHEKLCDQGKVHPYDYKLKYLEISEQTFQIDIFECGMLKLARDFDAEGMFPSICRVDYLMFHLWGAGFERSKILGDGDDCCNCRYTVGGMCDWSPEKEFSDRK